MFDSSLRRALNAPLRAVAVTVDLPWVTPNRLTIAGLFLGLGSAAAAATQLWWWSLALWLVSRVLDGLDGTLARLRRERGDGVGSGAPDSEAGGFLDIVADFTVYGFTVFGVGIGATAAFNAPWWPFVLVLVAYYVNGAAFLAFSSIAERTNRQIDDGRSLSFFGRIAEGGETIVVHSLWLILPFFAWQIALAWAGWVGISAIQRIIVGYRALR
ncbi:CDP-alcohol phosphatidyltransferase family protein [Cryobacterium psychrophilum]|uniref:CDP-alcohol phosphatidyltransferase family protein n=1 Tax=Cryobacterium psychrophilum TaxID=41988 RepID=A0A4Y8KVB8_9MICO|nr:CDP-alcohol phosphatidyltransferase family protein [Cryobacterium psychrophilum]TDW28729.1 phosphatidylglycerophosphate synthase [Cryobacterium psychrophilum]TFD82387.1 CDP-alcohol phosphatidyltransferase family protein [Cryobacterium psychrophilum]